MKNKIIILWLCLFNLPALADQFAIRARENYETVHFNNVGGADTYKGFTSTISFFNEEPYKLSYGLSVNLPLSLLKSKTDNAWIGAEARPWSVGGEVKYFPCDEFKGFVRSMISYQSFNFKGVVGSATGLSVYVGAGWEFPLFDLFSLAPEIGYRKSYLNHSINADTFLVSLGVHFYSLAKPH